MLRTMIILTALLAAGSVLAADAPQKQAAKPQQVAKADKAAPAAANDAKTLSGMSILGNQEAPKSLVIVPWKSSQLGDMLGTVATLDDGRQPVDKDVFMRELSYYEIRSRAVTVSSTMFRFIVNERLQPWTSITHSWVSSSRAACSWCPILLVGALAPAIAIERYITLTRLVVNNRSVWKDVEPALTSGDFDKRARE